jgi:hypothetical protein
LGSAGAAGVSPRLCFYTVSGFRLQVYEKLGLDPNEKPALKLESTDTFSIGSGRNYG